MSTVGVGLLELALGGRLPSLWSSQLSGSLGEDRGCGMGLPRVLVFVLFLLFYTEFLCVILASAFQVLGSKVCATTVWLGLNRV